VLYPPEDGHPVGYQPELNVAESNFVLATNDAATAPDRRLCGVVRRCRLFEFDVAFPMSSWLEIQIWDYDLTSSDDLIGSTLIDLENRLFSKHRARCGMQQKFELYVVTQSHAVHLAY